jgi:hypothetical protein
MLKIKGQKLFVKILTQTLLDQMNHFSTQIYISITKIITKQPQISN